MIYVYSKRKELISLKDTWLLVAACVLIGVSKSGTIILLPLLFILIKNKFLKNKYRTLFWSGVAFSILYSIGWSMLAVLGTKVAATGTTRAYQIQLILNNIPDFVKIYFIGIVKLIPKYYTDWVAEFGYWMGKVPWPVYALFPISLLLAMLSDIRFVEFDKKARWFTAIVGIFCLAIMASVKFVWAYVPGQLYFGSQGRYFLPFAPAFFIAFAGLFEIPQKWRKAAIVFSIAFLVAALGIYGYGVYRTYYTTCIFAVDADHPCTLPVYRNLDIKNQVNLPLSTGSTFTQTFVPKCDPIDAIDLRVLSLDGATTGTVQVSLFNTAGELLQQSQVPLSEIRVGEQNQFSFPTAATKIDEPYSFQISLSEDASATLGLWGTPDDGYTAGQLLINGSPSESAFDLYLQYECPR
ncbi:hypothetical protein SDC9_81533 [bioreactor metagenome]|uniref:Glycosyltransferase RgtA/B/C/D-like domain-containing protein n=1 Tax=bioreactor metagenome TaxID=1076179 RepID=A0A644Z8A0_9ZZZZ